MTRSTGLACKISGGCKMRFGEGLDLKLEQVGLPGREVHIKSSLDKFFSGPVVDLVGQHVPELDKTLPAQEFR